MIKERKTGHEIRAEDVLQEAYVRAYARLGGLADPRALPAWLARIVANEALGRLRLRTAARVVSLEEHRARARGEGKDGPVDDPASDQPDPERLAASSKLRRPPDSGVPPAARAAFPSAERSMAEGRDRPVRGIAHARFRAGADGRCGGVVGDDPFVPMRAGRGAARRGLVGSGLPPRNTPTKKCDKPRR